MRSACSRAAASTCVGASMRASICVRASGRAGVSGRCWEQLHTCICICSVAQKQTLISRAHNAYTLAHRMERRGPGLVRRAGVRRHALALDQVIPEELLGHGVNRLKQPRCVCRQRRRLRVRQDDMRNIFENHVLHLHRCRGGAHGQEPLTARMKRPRSRAGTRALGGGRRCSGGGGGWGEDEGACGARGVEEERVCYAQLEETGLQLPGGVG